MSNIQAANRPTSDSAPGRESVRPAKPSWLKVRLPADGSFFEVSSILKKNRLHTICQSAKCPNIGECWTARTATFLILGDTCTRACGFCAVKKGTPSPLSAAEPRQVADAVAGLGLNYVVVTSVTRDDLLDGGAEAFARTVRAIKARRPQARVEVLIPDFRGDAKALASVVGSGPDVINHNLETTEPGYYRINRPQENYRLSLGVLEAARRLGALTKSGLMVGLGEAGPEIERTFSDLRSVGCELLTIGQYLQPSRQNPPVGRYYSPEEFDDLRALALSLGFRDVASGPLVRSSYRARQLFLSATAGGA